MITINRALKLLQYGFSVMPVKKNRTPLIKWTNLQTKKLSSDELKKLNGDHFGMITGFDNLECIDVDLKVLKTLEEQNKFWNEYIQLLREQIDEFDDKFVIAKTAHAGYHIIYKCEKIDGNKKIAVLKGMKEAIIESRGVGGYIYIYDRYINDNKYEDVRTITKEDRAILWEISKLYNYEGLFDENIKKNESAQDSLTPWDDYNSKHTVYDVIGLDFKIVKRLRDKTLIKRNGGESAHSGYVYNDTGLLYLFSTATIYPHETGLSPFGTYAWKYHRGDYKYAASDLYKKGYGDRKQKNVIFEKQHIDLKKTTFPISIFPEKIQYYISESKRTLNLPVDYLGCSFLWMVSVIIGNTIKIKVKTGWEESANIWIGLIGPAGIGKTPAINQMVFPLNKKNSFLIKNYAMQFAKYKEYQELPSKEKKNYEEIYEPKREQFIVNDVTIEALIDLHEDVPNAVGVLKDELNGWIKEMNRYRPGSDLEFWLSTWSNKQSIITRKTAKSNFISSPIIPVIGGIQPSVFSEIATDENKSNGFIDRLLLSFPELKVEHLTKDEMDVDVIDWYEAHIIDFYDKVIKEFLVFDNDNEIIPKIVKFTPKALEEWHKIHDKITVMQNSNHENEYVKSMLAKQKSYIPRFALLMNTYYAFDGESSYDCISIEAMLAAIKLSEYFIVMARKIKIDTVEKIELKTIIKKMNGRSQKDKVKAAVQSLPGLDKKELAEILNISISTCYNYINEK